MSDLEGRHQGVDVWLYGCEGESGLLWTIIQDDGDFGDHVANQENSQDGSSVFYVHHIELNVVNGHISIHNISNNTLQSLRPLQPLHAIQRQEKKATTHLTNPIPTSPPSSPSSNPTNPTPLQSPFCIPLKPQLPNPRRIPPRRLRYRQRHRSRRRRTARTNRRVVRRRDLFSQIGTLLHFLQ